MAWRDVDAANIIVIVINRVKGGAALDACNAINHKINTKRNETELANSKPITTNNNHDG